MNRGQTMLLETLGDLSGLLMCAPFYFTSTQNVPLLQDLPFLHRVTSISRPLPSITPHFKSDITNMLDNCCSKAPAHSNPTITSGKGEEISSLVVVVSCWNVNLWCTYMNILQQFNTYAVYINIFFWLSFVYT